LDTEEIFMRYASLFALVLGVGVAAVPSLVLAAAMPPSILPIVNSATLTDHGKYTGVDKRNSPSTYDGSWSGHTEFDRLENGLSIALWGSEPGTLKIENYPYDEYALAATL
jgi:hypothetical protein